MTDKEYMVSIGKAAKSWRKTLGVSQTEFGARIGYGMNNISAFERGSNNSATILLAYMRWGFNPLEVEYGKYQ